MQAFFQGDNDNDNIQMIQAARLRGLTGLPGKPTVPIPPPGEDRPTRQHGARGGWPS